MDLVNNFNGVNSMSTRACYTFSDDRGDVHVYKHHDGYPYYAYQGGEAGGLIWIVTGKQKKGMKKKTMMKKKPIKKG